MRNHIEIRPAFCVGLCFSAFLLPIQWIAAWFTAAAIHELGHLLALKILKIPVLRFTFDLSGAQIETGCIEPFAECFCALAGPMLGLCCLLLSRFAPYLAICGFVHSVYNLLPFPEHDGGRVLRVAIAYLVKSDIADYIYCSILILVSVVLIVLGLYLWTTLKLGFISFVLMLTPIMKYLLLKTLANRQNK